jgi:hypothetical protein
MMNIADGVEGKEFLSVNAGLFSGFYSSLSSFSWAFFSGKYRTVMLPVFPLSWFFGF